MSITATILCYGMPTGSLECTGANCLDLASVRHALSIDCAELQGGCGCVDATRGELLAS